MSRRWVAGSLGLLCILIALALAGCRSWSDGSGIEAEEARVIALEHAESDPYYEKLDLTRVTVTYRDDLQAYGVDIAWELADEIQPGLWTSGFYVVVDAGSGDVVESYLYER